MNSIASQPTSGTPAQFILVRILTSEDTGSLRPTLARRTATSVTPHILLAHLASRAGTAPSNIAQACGEQRKRKKETVQYQALPVARGGTEGVENQIEADTALYSTAMEGPGPSEINVDFHHASPHNIQGSQRARVSTYVTLVPVSKALVLPSAAGLAEADRPRGERVRKDYCVARTHQFDSASVVHGWSCRSYSNCPRPAVLDDSIACHPR